MPGRQALHHQVHVVLQLVSKQVRSQGAFQTTVLKGAISAWDLSLTD